ncbi:hypothetical protein JCM30760_00090 [Thiomicrorhabdus hydrogeniphila]
MSLIRAILNNGFFIIVLIVAITLYLAYSDSIKQDHGIENNANQTIASHSQPNDQASQNKPNNVQKNDTQPENIKTSTETPQLTENTTKLVKQHNHSVTPSEESTPIKETAQHENKAIETTETVIVAMQTDDSTADTNTAELNTKEPSANTTNEAKPTVKAEIAPETTNTNTEIANFASVEQAMQAAQNADRKQDFATSSRIYLDIAANQPSANILGYLANALYQDGKQKQAGQAWLDSAKLLVKENRLQDASMLASRLSPYAPAVAQEIRMNVQKIQYHQMVKQQQKMQERMPQIQQMKPFAPIKEMPPMKSMPAVPQMQKMPTMNQQPMANNQPFAAMPPMANNQPMPAMKNYNPQSDPRYMAMQKQQQAQYQAYLKYVKEQQEMIKQRMPMAPQPQFTPPANASYPNYPNGK